MSYNKALEENHKKKVFTEKEEKNKKIDHAISDVERQIDEVQTNRLRSN